MHCKYIISDMDGVLLDTMSMWIDLGPAYVRSLGCIPKPGLQEQIFNLSIRESARVLRHDYGLQLSEEEIIAGITAMADSFYTERAPLKSGVAQTLPRLRQRGCRCYVATASATTLARAAFVRTGIDRYFDGIFCCTEMKLEKTDPAFFLALADKLSAMPDEMVLLEDNLPNTLAAKSAGLHTIALYDAPSDGHWPALRQAAEFACRDFSQILSIIQ